MRRLAAILAVVIAATAAAVLSTGATEPDGSGYSVRAIFDNASFVVPGEDVKIAGVKVGKVESLGVENKKAVITFSIDEPGFAPFHTDAHCAVRPQSLIGERYVECTPGTDKTPELATIDSGEPGAGNHLMPLRQTSSPVDVDLVTNVMRLPYRQRFAIIINEFGTALAGRSNDLNEAIHRANPALRETDRVLAILAKQNRVLANLAADSDAVIEPLARKRKRIAHFVVAANETGQATAERSADIERTFERLPVFLRELQPTLVDLKDVSDEMTPVLANLHRAAPDLNRFVTQLGPFSRAATPAVVTLGEATKIGRPALVESLPLTRELADFAEHALPVSKDLAALAKSLDRTGGLEHVMDYIFFQMTAINGFDGVSHYLRANLLTNLCSTYAVDPQLGCNANFTTTQSVGGAGTSDPVLARTKRALERSLRDPQLADQPDATTTTGTATKPNPFEALHQITDPDVAKAREQALETATGNGRDVSPAFGQETAQEQALDYLLGSDDR
jgi:phospholipid/cholesterol/gamma-HCH transport system substrate-binding protein